MLLSLGVGQKRAMKVVYTQVSIQTISSDDVKLNALTQPCDKHGKK